MIDLTPQRLSTLENNGESVAPARDKLVRMIYRIFSDDPALKKVLSIDKSDKSRLEKWLTSIHGKGENERIFAKWQRNHQWKVETCARAA
jgi:hypothetical protein